MLTGRTLGPYRVQEKLGAGGMGEVYKAHDPRLDRTVAIKVLTPGLVTADRLQRFEQEARAASALNHPHILTIHDVGRDGDIAYFAMEWVDGKTLREVLASGRLPIRRVLQIAQQIAEGLAKAHAAGIVHRDLKPENVMVSSDGFVKIVDFGIAKLAAEAPTSTAETATRPVNTGGGLVSTRPPSAPRRRRSPSRSAKRRSSTPPSRWRPSRSADTRPGPRAVLRRRPRSVRAR